jgi:N-methylhydantoinase A
VNQVASTRSGDGVSRFRIGIDTGGTFTDVVALDEQTGEVFTTKTPTTPADPSVGFMNGVRKILERAGFGTGQVAALSHGTTVATNALLAEQFPGLALVTTRGFRSILEIARQSVPQGYGNSYFWVKPERIVPLHHVREVTERLNFRGEVLRPFDEAEAEAVAVSLRERGLDCVGVCFLHAYANGEHERRMREVLARVHPGASVSISSEVLPEYREYERAVTTLVDAFVKPRVGRYTARIQERVEAEIGPRTPFYVMKSNGGVISAREVTAQPITTILSGPAAGALGAALLAEAAGFDRVLTLDGGGTSTDVSLVQGGVPGLTTEGRVGRYPVKVPMIDVVTVGTGGGSIAWRGADGGLEVGPRSAGADPGPMCYARGGTQPTTTDATLLLGRIPPHLLGGETPLDASLAARGVGELAAELGLDPTRTAEGILEIAAWSQANAVRQVSVKRGLDVRDYLLVAFGGSGPLQAGTLVDVLGLRGALIPPSPGNVSAFGLLTVDLKNDYVVTNVQRDDRLDLESVGTAYARLEEQAREALRREGFAEAQMRFVRSADLRYFGQAWEVRVEVPDGPLDRALADMAVARFHAAHQTVYGYSYRQTLSAHRSASGRGGEVPQHVEWVNLRVTGIGPIARPTLRQHPRGDGRPDARARSGIRPVFFDGAFRDTPIYDRAALQPGDVVHGPAIVEEFGSTTVVLPSLVASVDTFGNLLLLRATSVQEDRIGT